MAAAAVGLGGLSALPVALASQAAWPARAGFFVQGLVWLALLAAAIMAILRGNRGAHGALMLAMAAVASGAVWLRLTVAAAVGLDLPFETVYALAAWACWMVPLAIYSAAALRPGFGAARVLAAGRRSSTSFRNRPV